MYVCIYIYVCMYNVCIYVYGKLSRERRNSQEAARCHYFRIVIINTIIIMIMLLVLVSLLLSLLLLLVLLCMYIYIYIHMM